MRIRRFVIIYGAIIDAHGIIMKPFAAAAPALLPPYAARRSYTYAFTQKVAMLAHDGRQILASGLLLAVVGTKS